ncbi:Tat pathway signal protein [Kitasatospora sp. NPDC004240]
MALTRNTRLEAVIKELGWSQDRLAGHLRRIAHEEGAEELQSVTRSHISQWLRGVKPSGRAPAILCQTLARGLGRPVTPAEIGLTGPAEHTTVTGWDVDTVSALVDLGDSSMISRRQMLGYSALGVLPPARWWQERPEQARRRTPVSSLVITAAHVESLREAMIFFSSRDQRLGGGAGRAALRAYLHTDVATYLAARIPTDQLRRELLSAAGELTYMDGWMTFDSGAHALAQHSFTVALALAAEADDPALAGHILRAQAHQAVDLGHPRQALNYAEASVDTRRYGHASARERALLGVVHARALAAAGRSQEAMAALTRAEKDLDRADATGGQDEPGRVGFFSRASLAHETACTLRDLGDLKTAEAEFADSVRSRPLPQTRTRVVTLGYMGDVQVRRGHVDAACATWNQALDTMTDAGIQSGRARDTVVRMRQVLSPVRARGGSAAAELDHRAAEFLRTVG